MILLLLDCVLGKHKGPLHSVAVNVLHSLRVSKGQAYHPVKLALLFFPREFLLCHVYEAHTTRCLELCIWYKSME